MKKLVTMFVFLAITGLATACGDSPVGLAHNCEEGTVDPNAVCEPGG